LPFFESFSAGGGNTLRGYQDDRYRGEKMLLVNLEYRRPISDRLTAVLFVDAGDAFGGNFTTVVPGFSVPADDPDFTAHVGAGVGIRVVTPIGPIRLDFGWGEDGSQAHFSFGQMF
ncbi:MAG: BamA/TamA family outer membrane protein, partial [Armatimonadota bacterium]